MQRYKEYIKSGEDKSPNKSIPEEFENIDVKEVLHKSLKQLLEEVIATNQEHFKITYLNRVNEWYKNANISKHPIPPPDYKIVTNSKAYK